MSIVGSLCKTGAISVDLAADEKISYWNKTECYIALTANQDCILGAELLMSENTEGWQAAYGVFQQEAKDSQSDYTAKTINNDFNEIILMNKFFITLLLCLSSTLAFAKIWKIGTTRTYTYCDKIVSLINDNDTIQIDAAIYKNVPQVKWSKNNLYIVGVGAGRPRLEAGATIANDMSNGKGIFVTSGNNIRIENIEFANAVVVDHNGAGIRQEGANLYVKRCRFVANEMGILGGNIPNCKTTVEYCEFLNGGSTQNPGYQHNIYINHIDTLLFRYNYSHDAIAEGHEFKSRANYNFILYNRISNEKSEDSRTIDLPNGGTSVIVGNIIEQGENSANTNLLGYGLEGLTNNAPHNLWLANNTFINKKSKGSFVHIAAGTNTLFMKNNILTGAKTAGLIIGNAAVLDTSNNIVHDNINALQFANPTLFDYHLTANSMALNKGILLSQKINGYALQPTLMYKDSANVEKRTLSGKIDIGAYEYQGSSSSDELFTPNTLILYPNPSNGLIFWNENLATPTSYKIYDSLGKLLKTGKTEAQYLDISSFRQGIYFIELELKRYKVVKL